MIQLLTKVTVIDNTGAKIATCIKLLNPKGRKTANIGDIILVAIKSTTTNSKVTRGGVYKALVLQTKKGVKNASQHLKFDINSVALIKQAQSKKKYDFAPIGTRIKGPISSVIQRKTGCIRIHYLAKSIL
jgi:large subunit ribosomal protein L14|tara:strand:+ start:305 stop:694 length:390 start_codon:yes stop_codon:yes gene_type:complete